jgi:D-tyrosyl-tRNA(Tyr) deacylase
LFGLTVLNAYNRTMRVLIQRVGRASVAIGDRRVAAIGRGFLVLVGVTHADTRETAARLAARTVKLRIFEDDNGHMNRSLLDVGGELLAVPQFTLYADTRRGNRPSFSDAAPPELGDEMYRAYVEELRTAGVAVETGLFGARMQVDLLNDGPVTIMLEEPR